MTYDAQCNQVLFRIVAAVATKFLVVNFKIRHAPASLASPAITAKYPLSDSFVQFGFKPLTRAFG